jgi:ABC-type transport system substrate-binding protein
VEEGPRMDRRESMYLPRRFSRRRFVQLAATGAGVAIAAACAPGATTPGASATAATPKTGGKFVYASSTNISGFDPGQQVTGTTESNLQWGEGLVQQKIVSFDEVRGGAQLGQIVPALAESWTTSDDKLTFTFKLRQGVKFHDGTDFNADAVVTAFQRMIDPKHPYYFEGKMKGGGAYPPILNSIRAIDPSTVEFKLKAPNRLLLVYLAQGDSVIPSPASLKKWGADVSQHPTGTGPWRFVEWVPSDHVTYERNPDYRGQKTLFDQQIWLPVQEATTQLAMLERGDADIIDTVQTEDQDRVATDPKLGVLAVWSGSNAIAMNCSKKPFDDVRVRQAMNYAVNREEMSATLYKGSGIVSVTPFVPTTFAYDASLKPYPYDVAKAKQLLSDAGYPNGFEIRLVAYNTAMLFNPIGGAKMAQAIQDYLAKVGVKVTIQVVEETAWNANWQKGDFDMSLAGWGAQEEPDSVMFRKFHSSQLGKQNNAWIKDAKLDQLIEAGELEYDETKRAAIYKQMQTYYKDLTPWLQINSPSYPITYRKEIHDLAMFRATSKNFARAWRAS